MALSNQLSRAIRIAIGRESLADELITAVDANAVPTADANSLLGNNTGSSADVTSLSASDARTLLGLGTAALGTLGTSANNVVQLNGSAQLPAVSGALLTNLPSSGKLGQVVTSLAGAVQTGTTTVPHDDTIPQNTEGTEFYTLAITPANASSTLLFFVPVQWECTSDYFATFAMFVDTTADAVWAMTQDPTVGVSPHHQMGIFTLSAGSTSARTYKLRGGPATSTTMTINGTASARKMGGIYQSGIIIAEILP